jgi:flagellar biosynthesis protein FlhG
MVNRDSAGGRVNKVKLRKMVGKYFGIDIPERGDIPEDSQIDDALKAYLPICELYPSTPRRLSP